MNMRKWCVMIIVSCFTIVLITKSAFCYFEESYNHLMLRMEKNQAIIFTTNCISIADESYQATLLVQAETGYCVYIERRNGTIVNLATGDLTADGFKLEEAANGGDYTYARIVLLSNEMLKTQFLLINPFTKEEFEQLMSMPPTCHCRNLPELVDYHPYLNPRPSSHN